MHALIATAVLAVAPDGSLHGYAYEAQRSTLNGALYPYRPVM
jgi:hypothetical protein